MSWQLILIDEFRIKLCKIHIGAFAIYELLGKTYRENNSKVGGYFRYTIVITKDSIVTFMHLPISLKKQTRKEVKTKNSVR